MTFSRRSAKNGSTLWCNNNNKMLTIRRKKPLDGALRRKWQNWAATSRPRSKSLKNAWDIGDKQFAACGLASEERYAASGGLLPPQRFRIGRLGRVHFGRGEFVGLLLATKETHGFIRVLLRFGEVIPFRRIDHFK